MSDFLANYVGLWSGYLVCNKSHYEWNAIEILRLIIMLILCGEFGKLVLVAAVCCSSWVPMSRGSTHRSTAFPMGNVHYLKVAMSNCMVARQISTDIRGLIVV